MCDFWVPSLKVGCLPWPSVSFAPAGWDMLLGAVCLEWETHPYWVWIVTGEKKIILCELLYFRISL